MNLLLDDSIAALASAPGTSGRGIVRVSGGDVRRVLEQHFVPRDGERWAKANRAERHVGEWRLVVDVPWGDAPFQNGLRLPVEVGWWPTKRSYTGQPLAELHLIGSPPLLEAVLMQLCRSGCRAARPGEFTLRAFLAGRLDHNTVLTRFGGHSGQRPVGARNARDGSFQPLRANTRGAGEERRSHKSSLPRGKPVRLRWAVG